MNEGHRGPNHRLDGLYKGPHCKLKGPCCPPRCVYRTETPNYAQLILNPEIPA